MINGAGKTVATAALAILFLMAVVPAAVHADSTTSWVEGCGSNNQYGCTWWSRYTITGNAYPGGNMTFGFRLYNTNPEGTPIWVNSFSVQLPNGTTLSDNTLPALVDTGYDYGVESDFTIPLNTAPGNYTFYISYQVQYLDGSYACSSTNNTCSGTLGITVIPNPMALQTEVNTLTSQIASLRTEVSNLTSTVASDQSQVAMLTSHVSKLTEQLTSAKDNATSTSEQLATAQADLKLANSNLALAETQLNTATAELSAKEGQLASVQSSLNTADDVYLPIAAAVPAVVAVLFAILYFRNRPTSDIPRFKPGRGRS